jgi:hypothetical protein
MLRFAWSLHPPADWGRFDPSCNSKSKFAFVPWMLLGATVFTTDALFGLFAQLLKSVYEELQTPQDVARFLRAQLEDAYRLKGEDFQVFIVQDLRLLTGRRFDVCRMSLNLMPVA